MNIQYRESIAVHHRIINVMGDGLWRASIHLRPGGWDCPQLSDGLPMAVEVREAVRAKLCELEGGK